MLLFVSDFPYLEKLFSSKKLKINFISGFLNFTFHQKTNVYTPKMEEWFLLIKQLNLFIKKLLKKVFSWQHKFWILPILLIFFHTHCIGAIIKQHVGVKRIDKSSPSVVRVETTDDQIFSAKRVIMCAGAWTNEILSQSGIKH